MISHGARVRIWAAAPPAEGEAPAQAAAEPVHGGAQVSFVPRVTLKHSDKGWAALRRAVKDLAGTHVKVGVLGDGRPRVEGTITNVDLAVIHEYGIPGLIPERSFIRSTFQTGKATYTSLLKQLAERIYEGKGFTWKRAFGLVGAKMAADMKATIAAGIPPPNAPATIAAKGSSKPLVDSGQLVTSISWAIEKGK